MGRSGSEGRGPDEGAQGSLARQGAAACPGRLPGARIANRHRSPRSEKKDEAPAKKARGKK